MATAAAPRAPTAPAPSPGEGAGGLYRMSLRQYHEIAEAGILGPMDRVMLVDGLLVSKMTKGPQHSTAAQKGQRALEARIPAGWHVRKEDPITLPDGPEGHPSEPEPDLAIVVGELGAYDERHPGPAEVALVVEVAKASLRFDREMLARYAWAGIPVAWIVNLVGRAVEVHADPSGPGDDPRYANVRTLGEGESVPVVVDGRDCGAVPVRDLLP